MDQYLLWHQLTLKQQTNCVCDTLAKNAITKAMREGYHHRTEQLLPTEDVALIVKGNKITNDIADPLRFHTSRLEAMRFYTTRNKNRWSRERFQSVD